MLSDSSNVLLLLYACGEKYLVHHDGLIGSSPSLTQGKMKGEGER